MAKAVKKPHLLVVTERFYPEQFLINELIPVFVKEGFTTTVLTQVPSYPLDKIYDGYRNRLLQIERRFGARIIRVATVLGYKSSLVLKILNILSFASLTSLVILFTRTRSDAVFVYHTGPLSQAVPLLFVRGASGRRLLWTQDVWPDTVFEYGLMRAPFLSQLLVKFVQTIYKHCDAIAITSPGFLQPVRSNFPHGPIHYIPQWVPAELLAGSRPKVERSSVNRLRPQMVCTFAGSIGSMQNLDKVIQAFSEATAIHPQLVLDIIGDGSARSDLELLVSSRRIPNINFRGRLPMSRVMSCLENSDFLLLPLIGTGTVSKTIPAKFQAYLAAGRPIFAVASGTVADLVRNERLGVVADPLDVASISRGFSDMAKLSEEEIHGISFRTSHLLRTEFSRERAIQSFLSVLQKDLPRRI